MIPTFSAAHGLAFDLQVAYWHLPEAAALAADFPETLLIVNHTGLPADRSEAGLAVRVEFTCALVKEGKDDE